jgi:hypothetical protein
MRKTVGWAAIVLVGVSALLVAPSRAVAAWQRGSQQNDSRMLIGHVMSSQDQPQQRAIVYLKNTKTLLIKTYITDSDGSYRFPALAVNVDYEIYAEHEGLRSDTKTLSSFDSRKLANITLKLHSK